MAVTKQFSCDRYAIYNGDCIEVSPMIRDGSVHLSVYSPPFCGLYNYSSSEQDMSNCKDADEFFHHYDFLVKQIYRMTMPGRLTAVHVCDIPKKGGGLMDLPGDTIRLHEANGFKYHARYAIWKEPLRVAIRTRSKGLTHRQLCKDSTFSNNAGADYMLVFKKEGDNPVPVSHPRGIVRYSGEREIPEGLAEKFKDWQDPQTNKLAHWIWQQYASSFWDDVRIGRVLPYKHAREKEEEKHCHPLQLDVIERCVTLWSNPDEVVFTPFMGVGSEVFGAVSLGRRAIGIELKTTYYNQAEQNIRGALSPAAEQESLYGSIDESDDENPETDDQEPA